MLLPSDSPAGRQYVVWGVRGGNGATTVADALGHFWSTPVVGFSEWKRESAFISPETRPRKNQRPVVDAGTFGAATPSHAINVVVLRGPSVSAVRTLSPKTGVVNHLVLVREPWRRITNAELEDTLGITIDIEIPFSERVSRLADAGLLELRLDKLDEFAQLRAWAGRQQCSARLSLHGRQQVARRSR